MSFFLLLNTKDNILKNDWNQTLFGIGLRKKKYYGSQWYQSSNRYIMVPNIVFCVQQKKETHTGLQQLEGE